MPRKSVDAAWALKNLRQSCLARPGTSETDSWGHPNFRTGKRIFAAFDDYHGRKCVAMRVGAERRAECLRDPRFFEAPYDRAKVWVCLDLQGIRAWKEVEELLTLAHREASAASR